MYKIKKTNMLHKNRRQTLNNGLQTRDRHIQIVAGLKQIVGVKRSYYAFWLNDNSSFARDQSKFYNFLKQPQHLDCLFFKYDRKLKRKKETISKGEHIFSPFLTMFDLLDTFLKKKKHICFRNTFWLINNLCLLNVQHLIDHAYQGRENCWINSKGRFLKVYRSIWSFR